MSLTLCLEPSCTCSAITSENRWAMPEVYRVFVGAAAMLHAELINPLSQKNRKVWEETDRDMISSQGVLDSNVPLHQQSNGSRLKKKEKKKKRAIKWVLLPLGFSSSMLCRCFLFCSSFHDLRLELACLPFFVGLSGQRKRSTQYMTWSTGSSD
jgi:hypothetical protein